MEMGSEGWAVFDGRIMIASNLSEQDAQALANVDALLKMPHLGEVLMASLSRVRGSLHPNIQRAIRDFDDALVAYRSNDA